MKYSSITRFAIVWAACLIATMSNFAVAKNNEKIDSITFSGYVYDRLTSHDIVDTRIDILSKDSAALSTAKGGNRWEVYSTKNNIFRKDSTSQYNVNVPKIPGNYIVRITKSGYEPYYFSYTMSGFKRRESTREMPKVYMSRQKVKILDELTVHASKVKVYHKGDTIVYNADAFALPEGSMLDALIRQMPGVELKGDKIYVNGQFVESLLLNGKEFFKDNKNVMLGNIGAYAVKNVAVYEKKDEMSAILGEREDVDKEYVMDVRLKKDYMTGYMVNAEAGGGTKSRYLGRLFALQYTNNTRLSLYGNINNVNKSNRLTEDDGEMYERPVKGINKRINGGLDYLVDNALHTWEIAGNVDAAHDDHRNKVVTNAVNFLQTADNYEFSNVDSRNRNFSLSTYHNFKLKKERWNLNIKPKFSYNKNKDTDETVAATFREEMQNLDSEIIKSIYSGDDRTLRSALINRNLKLIESNGHGWNGQFNADSRIKLPGTPDAVYVGFQTAYSRNSLFNNTAQDICYGATPATSLLQNRFASDRPQYKFNVQAVGRYYFHIPYGDLNASYEFAHTETRKNSDILLMEAMAENDMAAFEPDQMPVPDFANSYTSKVYMNEHRIKLNWSYKKKYSKGTLELSFTPNIYFISQHLFYHQGETTADPKRNYVRFNIPLCRVRWRVKRMNYMAEYQLAQKGFDLVNLVDIKNTTDPLNVNEGNLDLHNSTNHRVYLSMYGRQNKHLFHSLGLRANWSYGDFVRGYRYDSSTGVRTFKTYNVDGNFDLNADYYLSWSFGYESRFFLSSNTSLGYFCFANMIGYDNEPTRQEVRKIPLFQELGIAYEIDDRLGLEISGSIDGANSQGEGNVLAKKNSGVYGGSFNVWYKFPFNLSIHSNIKVGKRFGYVEDSMNNTDVIWNASLGYSIKKGMWRFSLDGRDILNRNKGLSYIVNANGRKQTLSTVLPRYLMLSVHYRFDFKPKRR